MHYEKVTFIEYQEKKRKVMDSLGRTGGMCDGVDCNDCPLGYCNNGFEVNCHELEYENPLEAVKAIMDYEIPIDWNEVKNDTPILVKDSKLCDWEKRHFAKYENGKVYAWSNGRTSFTEDQSTPWNCAKLADKE